MTSNMFQTWRTQISIGKTTQVLVKTLVSKSFESSTALWPDGPLISDRLVVELRIEAALRRPRHSATVGLPPLWWWKTTVDPPCRECFFGSFGVFRSIFTRHEKVGRLGSSRIIGHESLEILGVPEVYVKTAVYPQGCISCVNKCIKTPKVGF